MRPDRPPLLTYYGDDLTGSTDVMEALSLGGVDTVLFLRIPDEALLSRFADCRAVGLAGTSRSESPQWMDENLTPALQWLRSLDGAVCHYKVCSTFNSSPTVGNIGRAIEIGRRVFEQGTVPIVVGAPQLRRYTAFGNLFAAYRGVIYRIDRHPVMSRHPDDAHARGRSAACTFPGRRTCVHRSSTWQGSRRTRPPTWKARPTWFCSTSPIWRRSAARERCSGSAPPAAAASSRARPASSTPCSRHGFRKA